MCVTGLVVAAFRILAAGDGWQKGDLVPVAYGGGHRRILGIDRHRHRLLVVRERWNLGLDGRARFDIGSQVAPGSAARTPEGAEVDLDLVAGPLASFAIGPIALIAPLTLWNWMAPVASAAVSSFSRQ